MRNILVLAYAISPIRGSEYSVAWNYVRHMSMNNKLTVLFGMAGDHMGDFAEMEGCIKEPPFENVTFVPVPPNRLANKLNWFNRHGVLVYTFYWAYQVWHKQAYKRAKELALNERFDLVHYLCPIGYREPGYLWKLGLPYMWGPICGAKNIRWVFFNNLSLTARLRYGFHNIANSIQLYTNRRIRRAIIHSDLLLAATIENRDIFNCVYGINCGYLTENGIIVPAKLNEKKFDIVRERINLIFVGRLDYGKNLTMLLQALGGITRKEIIHLDVVGDGPLRNLLERQTIENDLDDIVTFHGKLSRNETVKMFDNAHLHVITSIGEANTTVFFEAMSYGVPTLSLDHSGMHDTIKDMTGYKIQVTNNYVGMVNAITRTINHIINNPDELKSKAMSVVEDSKHYQWSERVKFFEKCYEDCIFKHEKKDNILTVGV